MTMTRRAQRRWPLAPTWTDDRADRLLRGTFPDAFDAGSLNERLLDGEPGLVRLEEYVDGDTCVVRAEVPGLDPEKDIEITVSDSLLRLSARREERTASELPDKRYRSEFRYAHFERSIRLPQGTREDEIKANYHNGILEIRVPTAPAEDPGPQKIAIERDPHN